MASIRVHRERKLVQRIFIQTGSQQIEDNTQVTAALSQFSSIRKPLGAAFQPAPAGPRSPLPWELGKITF